MKFSIVIPQIFYDLIARILPGFFFLTLLLLSLPELTIYISPLANTPGANIIGSLEYGVGYVVICYFLGQLFFAFTWGSKGKAMCEEHKKENDSKSINEKYQWIRLAHPAAGFRIVKLRAEARMFETSRTAMLANIILTIVYFYVLFIKLILLLDSTDKVLWMRPLIGLLIAAVSFYGFHKREKKAWDQYWGNINIIYDILHDPDDPVKLFTDSKDNTKISLGTATK